MLVRPSPLPDELALGYQGRLLRLNAIGNRSRGRRALLKCGGFSRDTRRAVPAVELLAKAAGLELAQFLSDHTTLPLRRAILRQWPLHVHGTSEPRSTLRALAFRDLRPGAYFCMKCVEEDLGFHGTPYWRREHQLPGRYSCGKHDLSLRFVESQTAFFQSPTAFLDRHHEVAERWAAALRASEPVQRFLAIGSDLLARPSPLYEGHVQKALRARALECGINDRRDAGTRPRLSDLIRERFDKEFLESVIPGPPAATQTPPPVATSNSPTWSR